MQAFILTGAGRQLSHQSSVNVSHFFTFNRLLLGAPEKYKENKTADTQEDRRGSTCFLDHSSRWK
jgi:hypothetical protein